MRHHVRIYYGGELFKRAAELSLLPVLQDGDTFDIIRSETITCHLQPGTFKNVDTFVCINVLMADWADFEAAGFKKAYSNLGGITAPADGYTVINERTLHRDVLTMTRRPWHIIRNITTSKKPLATALIEAAAHLCQIAEGLKDV